MKDKKVVNFAKPDSTESMADWVLGKIDEAQYLRMKSVYTALLEMKMPYEQIEVFLEETFDTIWLENHERMFQEVDELLSKRISNPKNNVSRIMAFLDQLSPKYGDKDFCGMTVSDILCEISEKDAYAFQLVINGQEPEKNDEAHV